MENYNEIKTMQYLKIYTAMHTSQDYWNNGNLKLAKKYVKIAEMENLELITNCNKKDIKKAYNIYNLIKKIEETMNFS